MFLAGDILRVINGPDKGMEGAVVAVRMFATDRGYYLQGGEGDLYDPKNVELVRKREGGNPCGAECDNRSHDQIDTCDHCRGMCWCEVKRRVANRRDPSA